MVRKGRTRPPSKAIRRKRKKQSKRTNILQKKWEKTKPARRHKPRKVGDRLGFKMLNGKRTSGKVIGVEEQYYKVLRKGKIYKVNRKSILYQWGHAIGATAGKIKGAVDATSAAYKTEREAQEIYSRIRRMRRLEEIRRRARR